MERTHTFSEKRQISSGTRPIAAGLIGALRRYFICFLSTVRFRLPEYIASF